MWSSPIKSFDAYTNYVIFIDHHTKYTWLYLMKNKSHSCYFSNLQTFKNLDENHFNAKSTLYSDNGGEFQKLRPFLASHGISYLTSPPHTPEHNGFVERHHLHIVETTLSLLTHASTPLHFWSSAVLIATYLINRMPLQHCNFPLLIKNFFANLQNIIMYTTLVACVILGYDLTIPINLNLNLLSAPL